MTQRAVFLKAAAYGDDVLALPVTDLDLAAAYYTKHFAMAEVERRREPHPAVILGRDGVQIGFAVNSGDAKQEGAAILVSDIRAAHAELEGGDLKLGALQVEERDGKTFESFFVVAPDELCYYFYQLLLET